MSKTKWWHRGQSNVIDAGFANGGMTNYIAEYGEKPFMPVSSFRPNQSYHLPSNKMEVDTTFKVDYQPKELQKHQLPAKLPYIPPSTQMATKSSYVYDYTGSYGRPAEAMKPKYNRPSNVKFDAMPTYQYDYRAWNAGKPDRPGPAHSWAPPVKKMDGITTFSRDFTGTTQPRTESLRPKQRAVQSDVPIEGETTAMHDFIPHPLERRSVKAQQGYLAPSVPMANLTTQRQDFIEKQRSVRESLAPPRKPISNKEPLSGSSEQRDSFQAWPLDKPYRHEQAPYRKPEGKAVYDTTTGTTYIPTNGRPAQPFQPAPRRQEKGVFEGNTNYMHDFKAWPVQAIHQKDDRVYVKPEVPFDGVTTFAQTYKGPMGVPRTESLKPKHNSIRNSEPLDGNTIYNTAYIPKDLTHSVRYPTPDWMKQREGHVVA